MKKVDFDRYADDYDRMLRDSAGFFSADERYFAAYKVELTRRRLSGAPRSILEFGCGTGRNMEFLRKAFPAARIAGTDVSRASLEVARRRNPGVEFHEEPAQGLSGGFDLVFVAGVLHHVEPRQRDAVMASVKARVAPGGALMVFEHNPLNPVTRAVVRGCAYDADAVLLYPWELKRLVRAHGLRTVQSGFSLFFPAALGRLRPLEAYMGWIPLGGQYFVLATA